MFRMRKWLRQLRCQLHEYDVIGVFRHDNGAGTVCYACKHCDKKFCEERPNAGAITCGEPRTA